MEKDWTEQLQSEMTAHQGAQVRIDGQVWTIEQMGSAFTLTNQFGNEQTFETSEDLITSLQARFENPVIIVL